MVLVALTVAAGAVIGFLRGGHLRSLREIRLRRPALAGVALACQLALAGTGSNSAVRLILLVTANAALLAFTWANRLVPGTGLLLVGFSLNAAVITVNSGMPVSPSALQAIGEQPVGIAQGKHQPLEAGDPLAALGDVLPVPALRAVYSIGDVAVAAGVGTLVANLMRPPRRAASSPWPQARRAAPSAASIPARSTQAGGPARCGAARQAAPGRTAGRRCCR
jgi:hypothetical protein